MSPRPTVERALAAALVTVLAGACTAEIRQPIAYNHNIHVKKLELACDTCHETSKVGEVAGLPDLATCATCHQEPNGTSAEEKKVVEAVRGGREIAWVRLYDLPRHVYFTHRRHVTVAGIACERCHGDMAAQIRPPARALVPVTMDRCMECHGQRGVSRDCDACHR
jgi:Cytochrome c7 and related cytochrome c/Class III cytochrome C family